VHRKRKECWAMSGREIPSYPAAVWSGAGVGLAEGTAAHGAVLGPMAWDPLGDA
jgi:hypothetical protein